MTLRDTRELQLTPRTLCGSICHKHNYQFLTSFFRRAQLRRDNACCCLLDASSFRSNKVSRKGPRSPLYLDMCSIAAKGTRNIIATERMSNGCGKTKSGLLSEGGLSETGELRNLGFIWRVSDICRKAQGYRQASRISRLPPNTWMDSSEQGGPCAGASGTFSTI